MTAADKILRKALVGSGLDTKGWSTIQAGLRDRAFFLACVTDARALDAFRTNVAALVSSKKSPSEIRRDGREYLGEIGYDAGTGRGTIKDLTTKQRLDVMMKTNADQAKGYVSHLRATTAGAIMAFPAYELVRVQARHLPRDWHGRWNKAAAKVGFEGVAKGTSRMIALKTSPLWPEISAFGTPYPPFDFNSGMGLRDVAKSTCREIGLLKEGEQPRVPPTENFNANLTATVPMRGDSLCADILRERFGDQVEFTGGTARWRGEMIRDVLQGKAARAEIGRGFNGERATLTHELFANGKGMTAADYELVPTLWRQPERVSTDAAGRSVLELDTIGGDTLFGIWDKKTGFRSIYKA